MSEMKVHILGAGGFMPFPGKGMPGVLLEVNGKNYLFDGGEGTQLRMVEGGHSRAKLEAVFVSHMHGDHVLGLPGVVIRRSHEEGPDTPLQLFGTPPLENYLESVFEATGFEPRFEMRYHPLRHAKIYTLDEIWVGITKLEHRMETYGFAAGVRREKRKFHPDKARKLDIPEGPIWSRLQNGESVTLDDGRTITPEQVSDPPEPGPKMVYLTDTRPLEEFPEGFMDPDILIHEAMFLEKDRSHAVEKMHSTALEAARVAGRLNANRLILTHASERYDDLNILAEEARQEFPKVEIARKGMEFRLN